MAHLLGLRAQPSGTRKRDVRLASELRAPSLEQAAGDPEVVGDGVDGPSSRHQSDRVFLELGRKRPTDPKSFLGHATLLLESTY